MAYRLDPRRPAADEVRRVVVERIDDAVARLEGAAPFDERVHEARKRMKEARSALRLVRAPLGKRRWREENARLRGVARSLSGARDAAVVRAALDEVDGGASDLTRLRETLDARHRSARSSLAASSAVADAVAELRAARASAAELAFDPDEDGFAFVAAGVQREHRRGHAAMRAALAEPTDLARHEWRKRVKDLWYHLLLCSPAWPTVLEPLAEEAHRLSEALGDDHDLALLTEAIDEEDAPLPERARRRVARRVEERRAELWGQAVDLGASLYSLGPKRHAELLGAWWRAAEG